MILLPVISSAGTTKIEFFYAYDSGINETGLTWSAGDPIGYLTYDNSALSHTIPTEINRLSMTVGTETFDLADVGSSGVRIVNEWGGPVDHGDKSYIHVEFSALNGNFGFGISELNPQSEQRHLSSMLNRGTNEADLFVVQASVVPIPTAEIDVQVYDKRNRISSNSNNLISVAIHSTSIADRDKTDFDSLQVNPSTLKLGVGEAPNVATPWVNDWDGDGDTDVIFGFRTQETGIICGDKEVLLEGETYAGDPFTASDSIRTTDCEDTGCHP
jgi:hypothetical protein